MKKTKIISLCMASIMMLPLLSGCGKTKSNVSDGDSSNGGKKDYTISMLLSDTAVAPYRKDWKLLEWIKEESGATLDIQSVPSSDYRSKVNMLFNSGGLPDIITHTFPTISQSLSGQLLAVNKYMDKLPNFTKYLKDNGFEEIWEQQKLADGNVYFLPGMLHDTRFTTHVWSIRKDIFEKNNIPIPKTLDDIISAGKKLKEIYPDSTPITNRFGSQNIMAAIAGAYNTIAGYTYADGVVYNFDTKQYDFAPTSQNWKDMLTKTNEMYSQGVLDKEYATIDSVVYEQKVSQGNTFIVYDWAQNNVKFERAGKQKDPDFDLEVILPPTGYDNKYALQGAKPWTAAFCLPQSLEDDPEHLDEVLEYINWGYSEEAETLYTYGKEGETFKVENGVKELMDPSIDYGKEYGIGQGSLVIRHDVNNLASNLEEHEKDLLMKISKECVPNSQPEAPLLESDIDKIQVYQTSLKDYCVSMMEKFINGSEPLSNWDKYVEQCKAKGSDNLLQTYNNALKAKK